MAICIPQGLKELIASMATEVFTAVIAEESTTSMLSLSIDFLAMLSDLDIDTWGLPELSANDAEDMSLIVSIYIQLVRRWDFWLALDTSQTRKHVLDWLESAFRSDLANARSQYAFCNASEQARVLLEEIQDGSEETRSSSGISRISNLQIDPAPVGEESDQRKAAKSKKKLPVVSLFCVQAMPLGVRFATGEYVFISRQVVKGATQGAAKDSQPTNWAANYDKEFPSLGMNDSNQFSNDTLVAKRSGYCLGRVVSVSDAPFCIKIKLGAPSYAPGADTPELIQRCLRQRSCVYWELSMIPANVISHMRIMDAIAAFLTSKEEDNLFAAPELLPYLTPASESTGEPGSFLTANETHLSNDFLDQLNDQQQEAVRHSLSCRVSLVHGPPGTGKSTTAIKIIQALLANTQHRVLVCAETNLAVDNLALKLLGAGEVPHGHAIRVGGTEKVHPDLHSIHLETMVRGKKPPNKSLYFTEDHNFFLSKYKKIIGDILGCARIVFTTCVGAGDPNLNGYKFDSVLMDEASMTTEPGALCPLAHGCCHLVLIGDHKQLGPHALGGQCVSLFERLADMDHQGPFAAMTMLTQQHRMHPKLCNFPSATFYKGELRTAPGIEEVREIPQGFFRGCSPLRFIQVENAKEQRQKNGSWFNEAEAERVLEALKELVEGPDKIATSDITVLTPYRAQLGKIQDLLKRSWKTPPEVCSVDGFQGRENEIIVVSAVRCGASLGFCDDPQRVNVLLNRAKRGLVVIGDRNTLVKSPLWAKWLREASS